MLLEWWPQSLVSAVATCFCWPVLRWFSTRWLLISVLLELLGCLGCSFRHVEAGAVQDALTQGQLCALGGSQFQGERSGRPDTRVRGARQRCRSDAARVQRGPVWRRRGRSPTVKNAADCRGGGGGGGGSSFGKRSGAADAATTGLPITHYLYIEISYPLPTPWEKPLRNMEL